MVANLYQQGTALQPGVPSIGPRNIQSRPLMTTTGVPPMPNMPMQQGQGAPSMPPMQAGGGQSPFVQGAPLYGTSPDDFLKRTYQAYLGRHPDPAGQQFYADKMQGGTTPSNVLDSVRNSPEAQIRGLYKDFLGREPDPEGLTYYGAQFDTLGPQAIRNSIQQSQEGRDYSLGDGFRDQARAATQGINNMPYIFSDYGGMASGSSRSPLTGLQALFGENAGQDTINSLQGLLGGIFAPDPVKEEDKPEENPKKKIKMPVDGNQDKIRLGGGRGGDGFYDPEAQGKLRSF